MASKRRVYLQELVDRLSALDGVEAQLRSDEVRGSTAEWLAIVFSRGEDKRPIDTMAYACTLRVGVLVRVRAEDATEAEHDGNAWNLLDDKVAEIERTVHADEWPDEAIVTLVGHDTAPPATVGNMPEATVNITIDYRHDWNDPDTPTEVQS